MKLTAIMKEENKKEVKKNIITGVSTASGAAVGTIVEDIARPFVAFAGDSKEPQISIAENAQIGNHEGKEEGSFHDDIQDSIVSFAASDVITQEETAVDFTDSIADEAIVGVEEPDLAEPSLSPLETQLVAEAPVENEVPVEIEPAILDIETTVEEIDGIEVVSIENPGDEFEIPLENMNPEFIDVAEDNPDYMENIDMVEYDEEPVCENLVEGDYTDTRMEGFGHVGLASTEMPDYVNDANIDSFMDLS